MSVRGTRHMLGREAAHFRDVTNNIFEVLTNAGYMEFIPSALAETDVFTDKAGDQVLGQMYTFKDKGDRDVCLIPEVTAICQRLYKERWEKSKPKPVKLFYLARCYRYERPQKGRYREFWQLGVENMGGTTDSKEVIDLLVECLDAAKLSRDLYAVNTGVKRGLDYYVEDGFEVEVPTLGAQKQIAGGGRYNTGIGWAIGIDRLMLAVYGDSILGAE